MRRAGAVVALACCSLVVPCARPHLYAQATESSSTESGVRSEVTTERRSSGRERAELQSALDRGIAFLMSRQQTGAVGGQYKVAVTSLSGLAVLGAGYLPRQEPYGEFLRASVAYLESAAQPSGYITEAASGRVNSRMHGHCYAILFLTQLLGNLDADDERRVRGLIRRGIRVIEDAQSSQGGWYYDEVNREDQDEASVTVCALQALRAAREVGFVVEGFKIKQALAYVRRCQRPDGAVAYSLAEPGRTSYALTVAALSTLNAAGVYESPELRRALDYSRRELSRTPRAPWQAGGEEYPYYANYYAAQAFYQDGGATWDDWWPLVRRSLLGRQQPNGSWEGSLGPEYSTAFSLLILEVALGHLPVFER